ncbi:hypothetical protein [Falsiroseomonas selenitidurans]|uniref:Uncharacterized protein n=1 Tax=Falsiroseomonas selenitidurans TaxID=2716335 RepID=A0ABX1E1K7_9PROT|nr:hypothetical protein [Falsiroseomonas selenitidurans]NKC30921.1 hypothetical protein [Falsiroseomonas selenitidurans]
MFAAIQRRLSALVVGPSAPRAAKIAPDSAQSFRAPAFTVPTPAQLAEDAALPERAAVFAAACRSRLPMLDRVMAGLVAEGRLRPDQQAYGQEHRPRFTEALFAIESLLAPAPDWPACSVLEVGSPSRASCSMRPSRVCI